MKLRINDNIKEEDQQNADGYIDAINAPQEPRNEITVEVQTFKSKKTGNNYEALKLSIGEWSTIVFPRTRFELNYIKSFLSV